MKMCVRRIVVKKILIVSTVILVFTNALTYMMLFCKNEEWKKSESKNDIFEVVNSMIEHVYYDGDSIPSNQIVTRYSRSGKLLGKDNLGNVLRGDKVVLLLTSNGCIPCAKSEIVHFLDLAKSIGRDRMEVIADFPIHAEDSWSMIFDRVGYLETDVKHLGLKGSPTQESLVVMLTQDGRIKTSFTLSPQTADLSNLFYEYLSFNLKREK